MKNVIITAYFIVPIVLLASCKEDTNTERSSQQSWSTTEEARDQRIEWLTLDDALPSSHPYSLSRLREKEAFAILVSTPTRTPLFHKWMYGDVVPGCEHEQLNHIISDRVWVGLEEPFVINRRVYVECPLFKQANYFVDDHTLIRCSGDGLSIHRNFKDNQTRESELFDIPQSLKDAFFLPYIYEERDWTYINEQNNEENHQDEYVGEMHPYSGYKPEDVGELKSWPLYVLNEVGTHDMLSIEYRPVRLYRESVWRDHKPSSWKTYHNLSENYWRQTVATRAPVETSDLPPERPKLVLPQSQASRYARCKH
jgi:hypothetical protein